MNVAMTEESIEMIKMGYIWDSQHSEDDILLISKVNNLNFPCCESSHWLTLH